MARKSKSKAFLKLCKVEIKLGELGEVTFYWRPRIAGTTKPGRLQKRFIFIDCAQSLLCSLQKYLTQNISWNKNQISFI